MLWALDKWRRNRSTADGQPSQPIVSKAALCRALLSEFAELRVGGRRLEVVLSQMCNMHRAVLARSSTLPACDIPDIEARIDRAFAAASEGTSDSEGSSGSPTHDGDGEDDEERTPMVRCFGHGVAD